MVGGSMKSILFTVLEDKLLSREKKQTFRTNFIPTYEISEIVMLRFKYEDGTRKDLYPVKITELYPKQIKNLTLQEAILDGFNTIEKFQEKIMELNKIKSKNHWGFITRWNEYLGLKDNEIKNREMSDLRIKNGVEK